MQCPSTEPTFAFVSGSSRSDWKTNSSPTLGPPLLSTSTNVPAVDFSMKVSFTTPLPEPWLAEAEASDPALSASAPSTTGTIHVVSFLDMRPSLVVAAAQAI